jgi:hypothetical protein
MLCPVAKPEDRLRELAGGVEVELKKHVGVSAPAGHGADVDDPAFGLRQEVQAHAVQRLHRLSPGERTERSPFKQQISPHELLLV